VSSGGRDTGQAAAGNEKRAGVVPPVSAWLQRGFHAFLRPYLRRHFQCIGLHRASYRVSGIEKGRPRIVYSNHPSWWDPLVAHYLNAALFSPRQFYAPIDAAALKQYQVFAKLGFYGVDLQSISGAADFLKTSVAILNNGRSVLWITPEGRFCDVRDTSATLMPGLPHLCTKLHSGTVIPMALEYVFWEERLPICLVMFGEPLDPAACRNWSKQQWNESLTNRLRQTQRRLADAAIARDAAAIELLLCGRGGAGGMYDFMRQMKSWMRGKRFRPEHGDQFR
jgi:1-acyl-sn-glycerol-3-phosphate acyltransferase